MRNILLHAILLLSCLSVSAQNDWQTYPYTPPGSKLTFPQDDGKHSSDKTVTEWWYINLHLIGSAPEYRKYDVMLCYFAKPINMRIFNISDPETGVFHTDVNQTPFIFFQEKGHWDLSYNIPGIIHDYSYWTYPKDKKPFSYFFHAESPANKDVLNVTVTSNRAPIAVGNDGFIPIGQKRDSSFYYTYSNMRVEGSIVFKGVKDSITSGIGWIDRQYGPFVVGINPDNMYEWYSLQVDEPGITWGQPKRPAEFNVWQTFSRDNVIPYTPESRLVSAMYSDDTQDTSSTFIFERTGYWYDKRYKKYYSQGWRFIDPKRDINIDMTPDILDQVIDVTVFRFWEGSTTLKGIIGDKPVDGLGFAELVASHDNELRAPLPPANLSHTSDKGRNILNWSASSPGTSPIGGYRIYRSTTNDGHWKYLGSTSELSYTDTPPSATTGYFYTVSSFDDQSATSASKYADAVWAKPLDVAMSSTLRVYPNPAKNRTYIEVPDYKNTSAELYNYEGKLLQDLTLTSPKTRININTLPAGVYFIQFHTEGKTETKRLVVQ